MSDSLSIQRQFFTSGSYAVAGASANPSKFGNIILRWYNDRNIPVVPVTPSSDEILGLKCIKSIDDLQDKGEGMSLSMVTPPKATRSVLEQAAQEKKLKAIWLQPGAEDDSVIDFIESTPWLKERSVYGGPCVLVVGDRLRRDVAEKL